MKYIQPAALLNSYTCPHCGVLSKQNWWTIDFSAHSNGFKENQPIRIGTCDHCNKSSIWVYELMIFPTTGDSPFPNPEMPENVLKLYLEASSIALKSPRGAAALLRLAIQILCKELGEEGKNINVDIASLVSKGLPEIVQQSLDIVRVTGNDAVHPGQIDTDNIETVNQLFQLINIIVEYVIALPKKVSGLYLNLPLDKLNGITNRDQ